MNIQPVESLSSIFPVPCERSLHLNLVPRNFLFQKFTILSIFLQNALRFLIAVKHSILSELDDVKSDSAAWWNTRKKSAISVQREVAFVVILGQIILDADYLLVERNWARIVLCLVKMLVNLISNKRALNYRGRLTGIRLYIFLCRELIDLIHDTHHLCTRFRIDGIINNYSSSSNGLWVNSPWGRRPNWLLTQRPWGREE